MLVLLKKEKRGKNISSTDISQPSLYVLSLSLFPSVELSLALQNASCSVLTVVKFDTLAFPLLLLMEPAYRELN